MRGIAPGGEGPIVAGAPIPGAALGIPPATGVGGRRARPGTGTGGMNAAGATAPGDTAPPPGTGGTFTGDFAPPGTGGDGAGNRPAAAGLPFANAPGETIGLGAIGGGARMGAPGGGTGPGVNVGITVVIVMVLGASRGESGVGG